MSPANTSSHLYEKDSGQKPNTMSTEIIVEQLEVLDIVPSSSPTAKRRSFSHHRRKSSASSFGLSSSPHHSFMPSSRPMAQENQFLFPPPGGINSIECEAENTSHPAKSVARHRRHTSIDRASHIKTLPDSNTRSYTNYYDVNRNKYVLVTGGAGYIGSHTVLELLSCNYEIVIIDNLCNSNLEALRRVEKLAGRSINFHKCDITSEQEIDAVFEKYTFWAVIHFAALKAVGESTRQPLKYYHNNLTGSLNLLRVMEKHGVKNMVFSSSATVYGEPETTPVGESARLGPVTNPYGKTKLFIEEVLRDQCAADSDWNVCLLRYFNPVGAHVSGLIGEHPQGVPNNLLPYVNKVIQGHLPYLQVFGSDYDTVDGTGVRDYIHVCDLATGHVAALKKLEKKPRCVAYNLGTGVGYSVLQIIKSMERVTGAHIPYKIADRRPGDVATCTADATLANRELEWYPAKTMDDMCEDMWRWTRRNPNGYDSPMLESDEEMDEAQK
ncbi:hypothetical protein BC943DRAFT_330925 [Umbelopsis sp. AD052]|nr:hypothetical protein BC943DRAFT_330925 [Umbelopsis sp. AD052]